MFFSKHSDSIEKITIFVVLLANPKEDRAQIA